jgi:predicted oxidoreductase
VVNQVQLSLQHNGLINDGVMAGVESPAYSNVAGTLDYCRLHGIRVQAWSPLARGVFSNPPADAPENIGNAAALVSEFAAKHGVAGEAIVLAWLLRHPAGIQPVLGTTDPQRIAASCQSDAIELSRDEWYRLFVAARGGMLP